ncbi:MAG: 16S rRNA (guanine(966)-N(2))-methyltransferase RsmD [Bdellovibrionales bacterium]|nr:16S rRNA (guanine(966)-N(2))-methyltransferase RsmD [Bdellovibrionales bacterium]
MKIPLKIIAGHLKGHSLCNFKNLPIRPMTQRVKKSVFDTIQADLPDSRVLDLFSGTGNLSFESLSRGALSCLAVEKNKLCWNLIIKNQQKLKIPAHQLKLYRQDVFYFLKKYKENSFDIIFADPPFPERLGASLIKSLISSSACDKESLIILELSSKESFPETEVSLRLKKSFGDKIVYFFYIRK